MAFQPRFGQAADAYSEFRPDYPPELFDRILAAVPSAMRDCAMDLGAGTGKTTRVLQGAFARVIAVELDPLMAQKIVETSPRADVRIVKAEDCRQHPQSVDLVNISAALHWMDAPVVMANVRLWLRTDGILAVSGGRFPRTPKPIREIIRSEFENHWNHFRDTRLHLTNSSEHARNQLNGLKAIEDMLIPSPLQVTPRDFVGFCRSTSYGSAYARTLTDASAYWSALEQRFRDALPEERFTVDFSVWLLLARNE
jgi:trans-aconitate methyltransferase